ncbi:discoidin domain-containing protein [Neorhodopirellula pilleata]|uniref:F5/8 type C domain-containing protein n=1 Tax=Neorhodopirellula pilleata TaxID=2714738 RepID=A0A5C6AFN7_9BACT|nr:discoidin domain-containing protein [Neorhodopirellula pilleata]TWT98784.1 hypothetical protein Pla100_19500 [Neorhodopirellula pilleata]
MRKLLTASLLGWCLCGGLAANGVAPKDSRCAALAVGNQQELLAILDGGSLPGFGAWRVGNPRVGRATVASKVGNCATSLEGDAQQGGAKLDARLADGPFPDLLGFGCWVHVAEDGNIATIGFQVSDGEGEALIRTWPAKTGWQWIECDLADTESFQQAYPQRDRNGVVDASLKSIHLVAFTDREGHCGLACDALIACREPGERVLRVQTNAAGWGEPGEAPAMRLLVHNSFAEARSIDITYHLQRNPHLRSVMVPHPIDGLDHAIGAAGWVEVDGKRIDDASLCDGDDQTACNLPWKQYTGADAIVDLGEQRMISRMDWIAGDANWIWRVDIAASVDGENWQPVIGLQDFDLHDRWGHHRFPVKAAFPARYLRLHFHKNNEQVSVIRMPTALKIYDGVANDAVAMPKVGEEVVAGSQRINIPARSFAECSLDLSEPLETGAYLIGLEIDGERRELQVVDYFVAPLGTVDAEAGKRFGINVSEPKYAESMRRVGFGWVRFENCKWQMFAPAPDRVAFDGSVAPWHVDMDGYFQRYHELGFKVLPYVFETPAWATRAGSDVKKNRSHYPPKDNADYAEAIFQLVARMGTKQHPAEELLTPDRRSATGGIDAVEIWNEPNLNDPGWGFFVGSLDEYYELFRLAAEAAKRADPTMPVAAAGFAGIDPAIYEGLERYRYADGKRPIDFADIINVHFYSGTADPERCGWDPNVERSGPGDPASLTYEEKLNAVVNFRERVKPEAEIWITETGNDVGGPLGLSERHQAAKLPRCLAMALGAGVDKVFIYREKGSTPAQHAGAGLLRNDESRRPSWFTMANMVRELQGFDGKALRLPSEDERVWAYLWRDDNRCRLMIWRIEEDGPMPFDLGYVEYRDAFGARYRDVASREMVLTDLPIYIDVDAENLKGLIAKAEAAQADASAERERLAKRRVMLLDFGSTEQVDSMQGYGPTRHFVAVDAQTAWDSERGWGFVQPGQRLIDAHWVKSKRERDAVRMATGSCFRLALPVGNFELRIAGSGINQAPVTVTLSGGIARELTVGSETSEVSIPVSSDGTPIDIQFGGYGDLRWITAIEQ